MASQSDEQRRTTKAIVSGSSAQPRSAHHVLREHRRPFGLRGYLHKKAFEYGRRTAQRLARERIQPIAVFAHDAIGVRIAFFGVYERDQLDLLMDFLNPVSEELRSALAIDVGANIGNHALYFASSFRHVCAFEPHPTGAALLRVNAASVDNISVYELGVSDAPTDAALYVNPSNLGGSALVPNERRSGSRIPVRLVRLDDLDLPDGPVGLLKVDVEGHEAAVLRGASELLRAHQPVVVFEQGAESFENGSTDCLRLLGDLGYRFVWHESGRFAKPSSFWRRLDRLHEIVFGSRITRLVTGAAVPPRLHLMVIAVPPRFAQLLEPLAGQGACGPGQGISEE